MRKRFPVLSVVAVAVALAIIGTSLGVSVAALSSSDSDAGRQSEDGYTYSQILGDGGQAYYVSQDVGIRVTGVGKVAVVPDLAILRLGVEAQAVTVKQAMAEAAEAMDEVMDTLRDNGVEERNIKTQWFNIYAVRRWTDKDQEILVGYRVTNMVTAKIRDVETTGAIIDDVAEIGGNLIRIDGVSFTVDDPTLYYNEAREKAIANAEAKAQHLAQLSGVDLGRPFYISEGGSFIPIPWDYRMEAMEGDVAPPTPISRGETEISLTVNMAFAIE